MADQLYQVEQQEYSMGYNYIPRHLNSNNRASSSSSALHFRRLSHIDFISVADNFVTAQDCPEARFSLVGLVKVGSEYWRKMICRKQIPAYVPKT